MADKKISQLTSATTPLVGTEVMPIVQSGATVKTPVSNVITASAGYTPDGTGAVARSVASKLQESVSVKDFGAVGDGTDATTAFSNAMATGKAVYAPAGTYLLNFLNVPSNTFLFGDGASTIIKPLTPDTRCALGADSGSSSAYRENVTIRDVKFLGDVATQGFSEQKHLTSFNGVKNLLIENCHFIGFRGDGLYIGSGNNGGEERHNINVTVRSCFFDGINKDNRNGISIIDGDGVLIEGNYFTRTTRSNMPGAIDVEPDAAVFHVVRNITIQNNKFYDIGGNVGCISMYLPGVSYTTAPSGFIVENNYIDTCLSNGLHFSYAPSGGLGEATFNFAIRWQNNFVTNAGKPFAILGTKDHIVEGNSFVSCGDGALLGFNTGNEKQFDVILKNNLFYKCGSVDGNGLYIFQATRLTLDGNTFNDCGSGVPGSANAIDFNTGTSSYVSLLNNSFITPTGKTLIAIQKEAGHTFTASTNKFYGNNLSGLSYVFSAGDSDYIEQTWTPIIGGTTTDGAGTYTTQTGKYTKIGRRIDFYCYIVTTAHTGSGIIEVSIPETSLTQPNQFICCIGSASNGTYTGVVQGQLNTAADVNNLPSVGGGAIRLYTTTSSSVLVANVMTITLSGSYMSAL